MRRHDTIVRTVVAAHGGYVFSTGGDGVGVAFQRAADAVAAAVDGQRALQSEPWPDGACLRVRMGLHTGEAQERGDDYFGAPLNRAARVMDAARGGQVALSSVTAEIVGRPPGGEFVDLGSHRLKGLVEPVHMFAVRAVGLEWVDRPLVTSQETPGNLPVAATEFVGGVAELRRRGEELSQRRLVTLTGPGGVGKTRVALEIGWLLAGEFSGGVWFVQLAPIADPDAVTMSVATALSIDVPRGVSVSEAIVGWLRERRVLLILDNCEHVLTPVVELVTAIVSRCPTATVLATSREPLGLPGERVHVVASLDPATTGVELFCTRALAADGSFAPSERERVSIIAICTRLDGIPLAIELAAARSRSMSPDDLLARLGDRFRLLRGAGRGGDARHQTLRATVGWSYQLLLDEERIVFDRLSVFAGGFDMAAAEDVCAEAGVAHDDVLDLLASLVDKSMVVAERTPGGSRYRLLETLREYGEERLADRGEVESTRDRHLRRYVDVAVSAGEFWGSPRQLEADAIFDREWANIRAAHSWAVATEDLLAADALVAATAQHAFIRRNREHGEWAERTLSLANADRHPHPTTYGWASHWAFHVGTFDRSVEHAHSGIHLAPAPDHPDTIWCWTYLAAALGASGRASETSGDGVLRNLRAACTATAEPVARARALTSLIDSAHGGDPAPASADLAVYIALADDLGAPSLLAIGSLYHGFDCLAQDTSDAQAALVSFRRAFDLAREAGDLNVENRSVFGSMIATTLLADRLDDPDDGHVTNLQRAALIRYRNTQSPVLLVPTIDAVAYRFAVTGRTEGAAVIYGHLDAHHRPFAFIPIQRMRHTGLELVRGVSGAAAWMARGAAMNADELFTFTLDHLPEPAPSQEQEGRRANTAPAAG